jgi:hypothetical protein
MKRYVARFPHSFHGVFTIKNNSVSVMFTVMEERKSSQTQSRGTKIRECWPLPLTGTISHCSQLDPNFFFSHTNNLGERQCTHLIVLHDM